ncbi:MAG: DNA polymerase III subunit gamma/tau [Bacteroidales bacterium]|nr:DNA polymerase III subunit gamma/tau [Bacteroidales bacterium]MDD4684308.1 DNA polymerase III subunit gamma/tau [Bacteroidales bacterium]
MENYLVSARKYRPADFKSIVGQSHITTTLQNAIKTDQLAQAFLFCGPRGVGKTTCARILAKTINCTNRTSETEACNKCENCLSFNNNSAFNIQELDAASNNSVDDIRDLVDQVRVPPQGGKYKVYIIDEVHMLSPSAFNAFLKTLEEPPAYAKFILATTEKHKIISTILSRCQIFDFHRINNEDISTHLDYIAKKENVKAEIEALDIIAEKSDGGLRDALSMFDQLVSFTGGDLTYSNIIENLNILDYDYYFRFVDYLLECDIYNTLLLFNEVLEKGFEGSHFINGLSSHLRNLLVGKDASTIKLMEASKSIQQKYLEQSSQCSVTFILRALDFANTCAMDYRSSTNRRLCVELALLKIANIMKKLQPKTESPRQSIDEKKKETIEEIAEKKVEEAKEIKKEIIELKEKVEEKVEETIKEATKETTQKKPKPISIPKSSSFSINVGVEETIKLDQREKDKLNPPLVPLDWDLFKTKLNEYAYAIKDSMPNLFFILTSSDIQNNNDNTVTITFLNSMQEKEFETSKHEIVRIIRKATLCEAFIFRTKIFQDETKEKLYRPLEKFKFLAEKNPALMQLKKEFDFDIDY